MYKKNRNHQFSLADFNQPMGLKLNPENQWIQKAALVPWDEIEDKLQMSSRFFAKNIRVAILNGGEYSLCQNSIKFLSPCRPALQTCY